MRRPPLTGKGSARRAAVVAGAAVGALISMRGRRGRRPVPRGEPPPAPDASRAPRPEPPQTSPAPPPPRPDPQQAPRDDPPRASPTQGQTPVPPASARAGSLFEQGLPPMDLGHRRTEGAPPPRTAAPPAPPPARPPQASPSRPPVPPPPAPPVAPGPAPSSPAVAAPPPRPEPPLPLAAPTLPASRPPGPPPPGGMPAARPVTAPGATSPAPAPEVAPPRAPFAGPADPSGSRGAAPEPVMMPLQPPQPGAYRPTPGGRSPLREALRAHLYLAVIVVVLIAGAAGGYWFLRVHHRIDRAALERGLASRQESAGVRCISRQSNGSVWNCAVVYSAESVCLIANVNPLGDWSTSDGRSECASVPQLASFAPAPRAKAIAADLDRLGATTGSACARIPGTSARWACLVGGRCVRVRAVTWAPFKQDSVPGLCDRKAIKQALRT